MRRTPVTDNCVHGRTSHFASRPVEMLARSHARVHGRARAHSRRRGNTMPECTQAKQQRAKLHTRAGTHAGPQAGTPASSASTHTPSSGRNPCSLPRPRPRPPPLARSGRGPVQAARHSTRTGGAAGSGVSVRAYGTERHVAIARGTTPRPSHEMCISRPGCTEHGVASRGTAGRPARLSTRFSTCKQSCSPF
jgi:hypothetical protein